MRYFFLIVLLIITSLLAWINIKLYSEDYNPSESEKDIILQLNYLEDGLKNDNLGMKMQIIFPEGYVFMNALYGLSWCELALSHPKNDPIISKKAVNEALFAYNELKSEYATWTIDQDLIPKHGIFYCGWKNYLLSKLLSVDTTFEGHELYINEFKTQCDNIEKALNTSNSPYLQSYISQSWPADMFVAIASLSNHDKIFKPKYSAEINNWSLSIKNRLDPVTHMIPHKVDSETGKSIQGSRGSSMSLILRLLAEINPAFAREQFKLFKKCFVTSFLGLPSIREFPKGQNGISDIDSGPVIFGIGFSGTIVMIGTYSMLDSENLAVQQYKTINAFGFGIKTKNQKKYLFGQLPMADAFIAWGRATGLNYNQLQTESANWGFSFNFISLLTIGIFWTIYFWEKLKNKIKPVKRLNSVAFDRRA